MLKKRWAYLRGAYKRGEGAYRRRNTVDDYPKDGGPGKV